MDFTVYKSENIDIHHIFPKDYCEKQGLPKTKWNSIINKTPITYSTNRELGGIAPSQYLSRIEKKGQVDFRTLNSFLESHLIHSESCRTDNFDTFFIKRAISLLDEIEQVTGKSIAGRDSQSVVNDFGAMLIA